MAFKYFRCLDDEHFGLIIRADNDNQGVYKPAADRWVSTNTLMSYMYDEGDYYDLYEEISEADALRDIETQRTRTGIVIAAPVSLLSKQN
jgi:hypothetical protein